MPICITCSTPVRNLYTTYSKADDRSLGLGVRLTQCPNCKNFADKYVEHDYVVLFIDLVLIKPQVYRHLLFNRLRTTDDGNKFDPSIVRLGILLVLFDVYITWARIERGVTTKTKSFGEAPIVTQYLFFLTLNVVATAVQHGVIRGLARLFFLGRRRRASTAQTTMTGEEHEDTTGERHVRSASNVGGNPSAVSPRLGPKRSLTSLSTATASTATLVNNSHDENDNGNGEEDEQHQQHQQQQQPQLLSESLHPSSPDANTSTRPSLFRSFSSTTTITNPSAFSSTAAARTSVTTGTTTTTTTTTTSPAAISTALLVSSCTKLFPILLVIWPTTDPSTSSSSSSSTTSSSLAHRASSYVTWAVLANNIEALLILLDCGYVVATGLALAGLGGRWAVERVMLGAAGLVDRDKSITTM